MKPLLWVGAEMLALSLGAATAVSSGAAAQSGELISGSVVAGRVTTLDLGQANVATVEVISKPAFGNLTVNPDNSLALVLTGTERTDPVEFAVRITYQDGTQADHGITLEVTESPHADGWGTGEYYMLEEAADGSVVIETGENHRKVYVSGSPDAWSLADIEAAEGVTLSHPNDQIAFLKAHPEYGTRERPLDEDLGNKLWNSISHVTAGPQSNWLLLERGYSYDFIDIWPDDAKGESALHPMYVGTYGEGPRPQIGSNVRVTGPSDHIVFEGLHFTEGVGYVAGAGGSNLMFTDIETTSELAFQSPVEGLTIRNSFFHDVYHDTPLGGTWEPNINRSGALFVKDADGVLLEGIFVDHSGWGEGYDPDADPDPSLPQPPSKFSHNIYIQATTYDVTLRENIIMRAAASGVQFRSGGFAEDNLFLDNNGAIMTSGGGHEDLANFTLFLGNVVTSGGYRVTEVPSGRGELANGITDQSYMTAFVDNIIAHVADPNNLAEVLEKTFVQSALGFSNGADSAVYDDTVIYNWGSNPGDRNVDGLDPARMNATTIQLFTDALRGTSGSSIADFSDHFRTLLATKYNIEASVEDVLDFFRAGFGVETGERLSAATLRFVPDERGEGVRWDNRLNWSTEDLPGTRDGDSVELAGNHVNYAGTTRIEGLDFGEGGILTVGRGFLQVDGKISVGASGARLNVDNAGQFWFDGYKDRDVLRVDASGGRFANTGVVKGNIRLAASDDAQVILATGGAEYIMPGRSKLTLVGDDIRVGFDGDTADTAVLLMSERSDLVFVSEDGGIGKIGEFRSGRFDAPEGIVHSGVNLGGSSIEVDVSDIASLGRGRYDLIHVDELIGTFGNITITGLGETQDAKILIDYEADKVVLLLGGPKGGTGSVYFQTVGEESDAMANVKLYEALTDGKGLYSEELFSPVPDQNLEGTREDDTLKGDREGNYIEGKGGNDKVFARSSDDHVFGGGGNDWLRGQAGDDYLFGQSGDDHLIGNRGKDVLAGGFGDDILSGGKGRDWMSGYQGNDTFHFGKDHGKDVITDFTLGKDLIHLDFAGASFADLHIRDTDDGARILTGEGQITLLWVDAADLSAADFLF